MKVLFVSILTLMPLLSMDRPPFKGKEKCKHRKKSTLRLSKKKPISNAEYNLENKIKFASLLIGYIKHRQYGEIKKQIKLGANLNVHDKNSQTPLHYAVKTVNATACALLLNGGAWINILNKKSRTPLHLFCRLNPSALGWEEIKEFFDQYKMGTKKYDGLDVNAVDSKWRTPLHEACRCNNLKAVKFLRSIKVALDEKDLYGKLPIQLTKDIVIINNLVAAGAYIPEFQDVFVNKEWEKELLLFQYKLMELQAEYEVKTQPFREYKQLVEIQKQKKGNSKKSKKQGV